MRFAIRLGAWGAFLSYALAPAIAELPQKSVTKAKTDPNGIVCEKQEVLGSRLAKKRVCKTRAEWAEQRRGDRDAVQQSQVNTCLKQAGC